MVSVLDNCLKGFHYPSQVPQMLHFPEPAALAHLSLQRQSPTSPFQQSQHQNKAFRKSRGLEVEERGEGQVSVQGLTLPGGSVHK